RTIGGGALCRKRRRVTRAHARFVGIRPRQDLSAAFHPVLRDDALDLRDHRPFDSGHHVAPHRLFWVGLRHPPPHPSPAPTPAPPTNATVPSTTSSSRCVRLFRRLRRYQVNRW